MGKIIVSEFVTTDGIMEDPGGSEKTLHGGWSFQYRSPEAMQYKYDELFAAEALLLGRVTYQGFAAAWPSRTDASGFADRMNGLPKYVASTTLEDTAWNNSTRLRENTPEAVAKLKQQHRGDILIAGSGALVTSLMPHGLIDEYRLMVYPLVLGSGKRLFGEKSVRTPLTLTHTRPFSAGIVLLVYEPGK